MPKYDQLYKGKRPLLQIKILKSVALNGRLSQKEAVVEFLCKPPTISDAFKTMKEKKIIEPTKHPDNLSKLEEKLEREKFYKLSAEGLQTFIKENPSPYEFWLAMIWYGTINPTANKDEFNRYYSLFIQRFIGNYTLRSCFFLGNLFQNLFQRWRRELEHKCESDFPLSEIQDMFRHDTDCYMQDRRREETEKAYKVLECLLVNRGIAINKIVELTKLEEEEVINVMKDYSMTQTRYSQYIDDYELNNQTSRSENITIDLLNHLLIVPIRRKKEDKNNGKNESYELSLLGVLLVLATISLKRSHWEKRNSYTEYYSTAASNYKEKLPLVFGKWELLKKYLNLYDYHSMFDYLLGDSKSEILSLSVSLGGNKEIYDSVRSASLRTISEFSKVYGQGINALQYDGYPKEFRNTTYYRFIKEKINEIEISLKYTDLISFGEYMKRKRELESNLVRISPTFEADLHSIENALEDEFSFSFYVGLLRENNHLASDYPLTTRFLGDQSRDFHVPKHFLDRIVADDDDDQIRKKLKDWVTESISYQEQALKKLNHIDQGLNNEKKITVSI